MRKNDYQVLAADEAARYLSVALGCTQMEAHALLAAGSKGVPSPEPFITNPKGWRSDQLGKWADRYGGTLKAQQKLRSKTAQPEGDDPVVDELEEVAKKHQKPKLVMPQA